MDFDDSADDRFIYFVNSSLPNFCMLLSSLQLKSAAPYRSLNPLNPPPNKHRALRVLRGERHLNLGSRRSVRRKPSSSLIEDL